MAAAMLSLLYSCANVREKTLVCIGFCAETEIETESVKPTGESKSDNARADD